MWSSLALPQTQLCLSAVLKCGQSFRWLAWGTHSSQQPQEYRLCLRDRVICLKQDASTLFYRAIFPDPQPSSLQLPLRQAETLLWLNEYFQLDVDLEKLYGEWATRDKVFSSMEMRFPGIRMLRQDPFENLISFICSSNNNIGRITKMVQNLCRHYSPPLLSLPDLQEAEKEVAYHPFPSPAVLAAPEVEGVLRGLGFGYRAKFIQRTAQMLMETHGSSESAEKFLKGLRDADTDSAREELLKFVGVGRKVADCILLMSLDKREVIPVDTHVHQIAIKYYGLKGSLSGKTAMTPKLYEDINGKLAAVWGDYAGWAHSILFTSDLKAFASYGLVAPKEADISSLPTPPATPIPRKRTSEEQNSPLKPSTKRRKT